MPSPIGHALAGIAAGWGSAPRRDVAAAAILAAASIAPDLDLLIHNHRGPTHSLGAALIAGALAWVITGRLSASAAAPLRRDRLSWAAAVSLAWASHVLLDWMSNDTRPPLGIMALWPFTREYYKASFEVFPAISRRYWLAEFWVYNLWALSVELVVLLPVTALVLSMYRSRGRSSVPGDPPRPSGGEADRDGTSDRRARPGAR